MNNAPYPALSKTRLQYFMKLHQKKYRESEKLFLAEGLRTVQELCNALPNDELLVALLCRQDANIAPKLAKRFASKLFSINEKESTSLARTTTSQGIFGVFRQPTYTALEHTGSPSLIVALDHVQDPGNVGTIVRTAVWFGAEAMLFGEGCVECYNEKVVRSCAGSLFALKLYNVPSLEHELQRLQEDSYTIIGTSLDGEDIRRISTIPEKIVLVIGNEANGITPAIKALAKQLVRIPHVGSYPKVESLNASISAAIVMERLALR